MKTPLSDLWFNSAIAAICVLVASAGSAAAMGTRSEAKVDIQVSVMPRFTFSADQATPGPVQSNAPTLRVHLEGADEALAGKAREALPSSSIRSARFKRLLLIVAD